MSSEPRPSREPRKPKPLNAAGLNDLALFYVSRFATTRAKLIRYLERKLFERGWAEGDKPDAAAIADRLVALGYVDDAAFAEAKARGLGQRGYGTRRVEQALRADGVNAGDRAAAIDHGRDNKWAAALRYAKRRRWGPYASESASDPAVRQRMLAAFVRAGHDFAVARMVIALAPGAEVSDLPDEL
ncbi:MAG: RecX family transcriptional regulator [Sphingopyxis sp.]